MCAKCVDAALEFFPDIPDGEVGDFLMNCTAFPLAEPETIRKQVSELRARTDDYRACYGLVDDDMRAFAAEEREAQDG